VTPSGTYSSAVEKPAALTDLTAILPQTFSTLKRCFDVGDEIALDLSTLDSIDGSRLKNPIEVAGISMRKIQLLYRLSGPEPAPNDVVVGLCGELVRSLAQLVLGTKTLVAADRAALVAAVRALQTCGFVVGTMIPPGEIAILE
jgi:hypothetical protein